MYGCFAYMNVCITQRPEEDGNSLGARVTDGCELPCVYWESNPGPLQVQLVLLTTEPYLV